MRTFTTHLSCFVLLAAVSCYARDFEPWPTSPTETEAVRGGGRTRVAPPPVAVHLPFPIGKESRCTQGAGGEFNHAYPAMLHDLDFGTSNGRDEEVYAPAGGKAFVHADRPSYGFGIHINIQLSDDSYLVLGHLKRVFIQSGEELAEGQLLGYEGCTGLCASDHVHIGRHWGNASFPAEHGSSVEGRYYVRSSAGEREELSSDAFVCDSRAGTPYTSALPVVHWHPDGSLVRLPDRADVYRIDGGTLRRMASEEVFQSYRYASTDVTSISGEEFGCYRIGYAIGMPGMVEAAYDSDGVLWLIVAPRERADRYRVRVQPRAWEAVLASWGLPYTGETPPPTRDEEDDLFAYWPARDGYAVFRDGALLRENGSPTVYVVSGGSALPIADTKTYLALGFFHRQVLDLPPNTILLVQRSVGSCRYHKGCVDAERVVSCGDRGDLSDLGGVPSDAPQDPTKENPFASGDDRGLSIYQTSPDEPAEPGVSRLAIRWVAPFSEPARRLTLSGEYQFADGTHGFSWHSLAENRSDDTIVYALSGVGSGDAFRFSVEYETADGQVGWSCIGQFPNGRMQGRVQADVDSEAVATSMVGGPTGQATACSLFLTVP